MAFYENAVRESRIAATTFASTALHRFVSLDDEGHVILPNTTSVLPYGVLDSLTVTTSTEAEAVSVVVSGICPVKFEASTHAAGDFIAASSDGFGASPTTDSWVCGQIVAGSSGGVNRLLSVSIFRAGPAAAVYAD